MVLEINIEEKEAAAASLPKDPVGEKLREIRRRLGEVEMRKEAIDRRQDGIDALALRTISGMSFLQGRLETIKSVFNYEQDWLRQRRQQEQQQQQQQQLQVQEVQVHCSYHETEQEDVSEQRSYFKTEEIEQRAAADDGDSSSWWWRGYEEERQEEENEEEESISLNLEREDESQEQFGDDGNRDDATGGGDQF